MFALESYGKKFSTRGGGYQESDGRVLFRG
jgi:hypothetical protein